MKPSFGKPGSSPNDPKMTLTCKTLISLCTYPRSRKFVRSMMSRFRMMGSFSLPRTVQWYLYNFAVKFSNLFFFRLPTVTLFVTPDIISEKVKGSLLRMLVSEHPRNAPNGPKNHLDMSKATCTPKPFYTAHEIPISCFVLQPLVFQRIKVFFVFPYGIMVLSQLKKNRYT